MFPINAPAHVAVDMDVAVNATALNIIAVVIAFFGLQFGVVAAFVRWLLAIEKRINAKVETAVYEAEKLASAAALAREIKEMKDLAAARATYTHEMRHEQNNNMQVITMAVWMIAEKLQIKLPPTVRAKLQDMGDNLG